MAEQVLSLLNGAKAEPTLASDVSGPGETRVKYGKQPAYLGMVFAAALALAACGGKGPQTGTPNGSTVSNSVMLLKRRLSEIAGQANQAAPADIDANTRLDGAKAGPGLRLTSSYTLLNPESEGIDSTTFEAKLGPVVKNGSCKNPDLRPLIDQGVVVVLEYRGNDGKPIGTVSIDRATCGAIR
jgi:hypothetical protein